MTTELLDVRKRIDRIWSDDEDPINQIRGVLECLVDYLEATAAPDAPTAPLHPTCPTCHRVIVKDAHGGPHPSPGDHDPAPHVAAAYGMGLTG